MDLKNFESVRKAAGELRKSVDHIDILIFNAGGHESQIHIIGIRNLNMS